jgi:hypothetical protein
MKNITQKVLTAVTALTVAATGVIGTTTAAEANTISIPINTIISNRATTLAMETCSRLPHPANYTALKLLDCVYINKPSYEKMIKERGTVDAALNRVASDEAVHMAINVCNRTRNNVDTASADEFLKCHYNNYKVILKSLRNEYGL